MSSPTDPRAALLEFIASKGTQKNAAAALGVSATYLVDLKRGRRGFSDVMLRKLGLERIVLRRAS